MRRLLRRLRDYALRNRPVAIELAGGRYRVLYSTRLHFGAGYDRGAHAVVDAALRPGTTAWTVGANVGQWALPTARAVGPSGKVLAIEPNPQAALLLRRNLALNGLVAEVREVAAGGENGEVDFHATEADPMSRPGRRNPLLARARTITVTVVPLDSLAVALPPDAVVIDVEGWEIEALKGARRLLAVDPLPVVVVEFHPNAWEWNGQGREDMELLLRELQLEAVPLSEQGDPLAEHGQVLLRRAGGQ